ncbi:Aminomethyltransferase [Streptomyces hirsutus]
MICREDGGILDDLIVYRLDDTEAGSPRYLVVANASNAQVVLDALVERSAGFDTEVRDDRDAYALLAVQGPESPGILQSLTDTDLEGMKCYAGRPRTAVAGVPALIDPYRLHRRGRLRAVREAGARGGAVAGVDRGGRGRRPDPVRAVLPGHAASGGPACRCTAMS